MRGEDREARSGTEEVLAVRHRQGDRSMAPNEAGPIIQHAIQLAIAPVFLLTGIASLLGVMANRLARIIDRARVLEQRWAALSEQDTAGGPRSR